MAAIRSAPVQGGEIAGLPSQLPPTIDRDLDVSFINDFIGRGGSTDDFRTQQLIIAAKFGDRWTGLIDHSILTRNSVELTERADTLSVSLGYRLIDTRDDGGITNLTLGAGLRSIGDFAGERMQNGFHRLVGSKVTRFPYTDSDRTDATIWLDAQRYVTLREAGRSGKLGDWRTGFWVRGSSLFTSDGQLDASASAFAVANRNAVDLWLGFRQDWRSGYNDDVLRAVAHEEEDLAIVIGARFGALVIETVQQLNNEASYGQLRLVSTGYRAVALEDSRARMELDLGFVIPDVHVQLGARFSPAWLTTRNSTWQRSLSVDLRFGEPQQADDPSIYIRSRQLTAGLRWDRPVSTSNAWMSVYADLGLGWRSEKPILQADESATTGQDVSRAVLAVGTGLRFRAATLGSRWKYNIQTGLTAWLPFSDATREFQNEIIHLQKPAVGFQIGMTFDYD